MTIKFNIWQYRKHILLVTVIVFSFIYALPNIYGEDPCVQIALVHKIANNSNKVVLQSNPKDLIQNITNELISKNLRFKSIKTDNNNNITVHFVNTEIQLTAKDSLQELLGEQYNVVLNLASGMPNWLTYFGATPMKLGLDLRGGIRFLMNVDVQSVAAENKNYIVEQTIEILRNRINELGIAEAAVQRHGSNNIIIELPGVQDIVRAKNILGKTATLDFVMVDENNMAGIGNRALKDRFGRTVFVKKKVILTGDAIIGATSEFDPRDHKPVVSLRLRNKGINFFKKTTMENIGKTMGIIYREHKIIEKNSVKTSIVEETVISVATIQSALGNHFQISGFNVEESRELALLLRSGAMPSTVSIMEEQIIGPSMGQENIKMGMISVVLGLSLVVVVMLIYYSLFGLIANLALLLNLILLIAGMSLIGATLTLPGIAGIVLTLGMAVDANVLIFERIREEMQNGISILTSIKRGFEYALATIVDSNLTTLIVGIILFFIGTGPIKGFAVVLSIGILTSLFTATICTSAMVNMLYEGKHRLKKIWIGI
jgi:preprotein translocase subunit SecD